MSIEQGKDKAIMTIFFITLLIDEINNRMLHNK